MQPNLNEQSQWKPRPWMWCVTILLVALLALGSILARNPQNELGGDAERLYVNQDATWHVLHTMACYDGISAAEHLYLPLVTPNDDARGLVWGATTPDENGLYYYTSFWPAGFAAPWAFAKLTGLPYLPQTLYIFNSILYAAGAALAALCMARLLGGRLHPCLVAGLAAALYLFQPEVMQSQGAVYWHHSLNQVLLLGQLCCFTFFDKRAGKTGFFILCLLTPLVEYTGFVANAGYCLLLLVKGGPGPVGVRALENAAAQAESPKPKRGKAFWLPRLGGAGLAGGLTLLAGAATLFHYTRKLPLAQVLNAMFGSYAVRGDASRDPLLQLLAMYFRSFRYLWPVLALLLVGVLVLPLARKALPGMLKAFWPWFLVTLFPMLENLLLRQHTVEYSYARMKGVVPMLLAFFVLVACLRRQLGSGAAQRLLAAAVCGVALLAGGLALGQYQRLPNRYVEVITYMPVNQRLADKLLQSYARTDSFYGTNMLVRGYTNHLFEGGVMEWCSLEETVEECRARGKRYAVYLEARWGTSNTYQFLSATVVDLESGSQEHIVAG